MAPHVEKTQSPPCLDVKNRGAQRTVKRTEREVVRASNVSR
jgi:hypothetical protein